LPDSGYGQLEQPEDEEPHDEPHEEPHDEPHPNHQKNGRQPPLHVSTNTSVVLQEHSVMLGTSLQLHELQEE
jgi:hypothetical protein